jgi:outer membrane protein assembly factor BamB
MSTRRGRSIRLALRWGVLLSLLLGTSAAVAASPVSTTPPRIDWDTYGFDLARNGFNPNESQLRPGNVDRLHLAWSVKIGGLMNTQPLYAASVLVPKRGAVGGVVSKDLVIAATDTGRVAAVDAATGKKVWERRLGYRDDSCGDLPHYGITGTPTIDRATNSVYVGDGQGRVDRLDLSTGRVRHRSTITHHPGNGHNYSALTLVDGVVYAELAGYCDRPPYRGEIAAINTRTGHVKHWFITPTNGGGIWGFGGISADPSAHALYAATGNSVAATDHEGYSERVVRLTPDLRVTASNYPGLPLTGDADFGATPMLYRAPGCPRQLAVGNKSGAFFVYDRNGIGNGPVQRITLGGSSNGGDALIGVDAYLPSERTVYVSNPNAAGGYRPGILAFRVTHSCHLSLRWQAPGPGHTTSSPTVAGGVVFYGTGPSGTVIALDARTGKRLWVHSVGHTIFGAPTVVNGAVYVSAWDGRLRAFVPR